MRSGNVISVVNMPVLMGVVFNSDITQEQVNAIVNRTRLFGIGFSWGGYESLILPIHPYRSIQSEQWKNR